MKDDQLREARPKVNEGQLMGQQQMAVEMKEDQQAFIKTTPGEARRDSGAV